MANTFVYADNLKNEFRGKRDDLSEAIRQGHGSPNFQEFEAARVDPEFVKVRDQFLSKARNEAEADEEFEPEVDGEMGIIYHKGMD